MPELPEVETIRVGLEPDLVGRAFDHVEISDSRLTRPHDPREIAAELEGERSQPSSVAASIWLFGSRAVEFS